MVFCVFVASAEQRLDCACAVGLGFGPLVFILWASIGALCFFNIFCMSFGVPLGPHFLMSAGVGVRGGTQLIAFKNKALVTCTSNPCFRSATGPSTCSLVGSSLEPAAGSTSPSASTQPREAFCTNSEASASRIQPEIVLKKLWDPFWHPGGFVSGPRGSVWGSLWRFGAGPWIP